MQDLTDKELADAIEEQAGPALAREVYRRLAVPKPVDTDQDARIQTLVEQNRRMEQTIRRHKREAL